MSNYTDLPGITTSLSSTSVVGGLAPVPVKLAFAHSNNSKYFKCDESSASAVGFVLNTVSVRSVVVSTYSIHGNSHVSTLPVAVL